MADLGFWTPKTNSLKEKRDAIEKAVGFFSFKKPNWLNELKVEKIELTYNAIFLTDEISFGCSVDEAEIYFNLWKEKAREIKN